MAPGKWESGDVEQLITSERMVRQQSKLWVFRGLAISLSLITCLLCLETAFRLWGPEYHQFHTFAIYDSNPRGYFDEFGEEDGVMCYTIVDNCWPEAMIRLPDDVRSDAELEAFAAREVDVLALGDSFTYGRGVRYDDIYVRQLEELLARDNHPLQIGSLAYAGNDMEEIGETYNSVRQPGRFPLVVYGFVLNDFGLPGAERIVGSDYIDFGNGGNEQSPWRRRSALFNAIGHYLDTIQTDRVTKKAYLAAFEGENARKYFAMLGDLNRQIEADGGQLAIMLFPLLHRFDNYPFQGIHDKIADFCKREDIPILDLLPTYSEHGAEDLWVHPADHHPNEIGHRIAAEELHTFLKREDLLPPSRAAKRETLTLNGDASAE